MEKAYCDFLLREPEDAFETLRCIADDLKGKYQKEVEYFLVQFNTKRLYNIFYDDKDERKYIYHIDLYKIIADELEYGISNEVRAYLLKIAEGHYYNNINKKVKKLIEYIRKKKETINNGGTFIGANYFNELFSQVRFLYYHSEICLLFENLFTEYKEILSNIIEGFVEYSLIRDKDTYPFPGFVLWEAVLNLSTKQLTDNFDKLNLINISDKDINEFIVMTNNFLSSHYDEFFGFCYINKELNKHIQNFQFEDQLRIICSNLFYILSKIDIKKKKNNLHTLSINIEKYLRVENYLNQNNLKYIGDFILSKGYLFSKEFILALLEIALKNLTIDSVKYIDFIKTDCLYITKFHDKTKYSKLSMIQKAITNCYSDDEIRIDYTPLIPLLSIVDEKCKDYLINVFEGSLEKHFNEYFYDILIRGKHIDYKKGNYFYNYISRYKNLGNLYNGFKNNNVIFISSELYNITLLIYILDIEWGTEYFSEYKNINSFERWMLNPLDFNYSHFDVKWLTIFEKHQSYVLLIMEKIPQIKEKLLQSLNAEYNEQLARIYFCYFR